MISRPKNVKRKPQASDRDKQLITRTVAEDANTLKARLAQVEKEVGVFKQAKKSAELLTLDVRAQLKQAEVRLDELRTSSAHRLGTVLMKGFAGWRNLLALPRELRAWNRLHRAALADAAADILPLGRVNEATHVAELALARAQEHGAAAAEAWVQNQRLPAPILSRVLLELAKTVRRSDSQQSVVLAKAAVEADPNQHRVKQFAMILMDAGAYREAFEVIQAAIAVGAVLNGTEERRYEELLAFDRLDGRPLTLPPRTNFGPGGSKRTILVYAQQSLPFHWSSISLRAHGLAQFLQSAECEVHVATPPGYPPGKAGQTRPAPNAVVNGVTYHRLSAVVPPASTIDDHARAGGAALALVARSIEAGAIIAPAELGSAYLAGFASRAAGAAFVLDGASLETRSYLTDHQGFLARSVRSLLQQADRVILRWPAAAAVLRADGIPDECLVAVPDTLPSFPAEFDPPDWRADPALSGRLVIGYLGDPHEDVDLEALTPAFDRLVGQGHDAALMIVGVGSRFNSLKEELVRLGHGDRILFPGRPRPGATAAAFNTMDVVVVPARTTGVRLRSQFEISYALAHGCPVVTTASPDVVPADRRKACRFVEEADSLSAALIEIASVASGLETLRQQATLLATLPYATDGKDALIALATQT